MAKEERKTVLVQIRYTETYEGVFSIPVPENASQEEVEEAWRDAVENGDVNIGKVEMTDSDIKVIREEEGK